MVENVGLSLFSTLGMSLATLTVGGIALGVLFIIAHTCISILKGKQ